MRAVKGVLPSITIKNTIRRLHTTCKRFAGHNVHSAQRQVVDIKKYKSSWSKGAIHFDYICTTAIIHYTATL